MGEYLHRSVHDNYAARHKGWYDNGGSMASVLSQEGAPAGERIARSKYQSAQVGAILGVGDGATAAPPAHRAGRKLTVQYYPQVRRVRARNFLL